jgi:hypothetical protein
MLLSTLLFFQKYTEVFSQIQIPFSFNPSHTSPSSNMGGGSSEGYRSVAYFVNW